MGVVIFGAISINGMFVMYACGQGIAALLITAVAFVVRSQGFWGEWIGFHYAIAKRWFVSRAVRSTVRKVRIGCTRMFSSQNHHENGVAPDCRRCFCCSRARSPGKIVAFSLSTRQ